MDQWVVRRECHRLFEFVGSFDEDAVNSVSVQAPIDEVFAAVADIERVVPCVPGAKVLERRGEDVYEVALKAHLGPVWKRYLGTITVVAREADAHRVVMTVLATRRSSTVCSPRTPSERRSAKQMTEFTANLRTMVGGAPQP